MEHDVTHEKPNWPFTCYSHIRSHPGVTASTSLYGSLHSMKPGWKHMVLCWCQTMRPACHRQVVAPTTWRVMHPSRSCGGHRCSPQQQALRRTDLPRSSLLASMRSSNSCRLRREEEEEEY